MVDHENNSVFLLKQRKVKLVSRFQFWSPYFMNSMAETPSSQCAFNPNLRRGCVPEQFNCATGEARVSSFDPAWVTQ